MACAFLVVITLGIRQSFGLFLLPVTEALGSGREVFSLAMAMQNLVWGLASPIAGAMADKFGAARVAMIGALFYAGGLFLMGAVILPGGLLFGQIMIGIGPQCRDFYRTGAVRPPRLKNARWPWGW